jgi:hypothetical protein
LAGYHIGTKTVTNGIVAPHVLWSDEPVDVTADQAIAAVRELLANGPVSAVDGDEAAKANGIKGRTLDRARKELGIKAEKGGFDGGWAWKLSA